MAEKLQKQSHLPIEDKEYPYFPKMTGKMDRTL